MAAGIGLIAAPLLVGAGTAALITGTVLAGTASEGRGTLPLSAQAAYDRGLALGLFIVAAIFAMAGETEAAPIFAAVGAVALVVTSITRYSVKPA